MRVVGLLSSAVSLAALFAFSGAAASQARALAPTLAGASTPSQELDAKTIRTLVDTVSRQIEQLYVDADTAKLIAQVLRASLAKGAYDHPYDGNRLAELMTADLRSVNHDLHLGVRFVAPGSAGAARPGMPAFLGREQHYALGRIDVLPGNIGYLELTGFAIDTVAQSAVVAALEYLESTDAIIIDLRRNRGGSGELSNFLISHFTGTDTIASLKVTSRSTDENFVRYTLPSVPGPRRPTVPLYLLTSRGTASAGEDFAFVLQNLKRATIVGDRTAGAGHNVDAVTSGYGFTTSISVTRVSDPKTGKEWERVGVQPDVRVEPGTALDVAQIAALRALESSAPAESRAHLAFLRDTREAILHRHDVASATLAKYAGEYDGDRVVRVANGRLLYVSALGALPDTLVSLSDSVFAASTQSRLTFVRSAQNVVELHILTAEGIDVLVKRKSSR